MQKVTALVKDLSANETDRFRLRVTIQTVPPVDVEVSNYIEQNSDRVRAKYLRWVYEVGEQLICESKTVSQLLEINQTLNLWHMSLIAEKSIWKTPQILDALHIIALQEILASAKASHVILKSNNQILNQMIGQICVSLNYQFNSMQTIGGQTEIAGHPGRWATIIQIAKYAIPKVFFVLFGSRSKFSNLNPKYIFVSYFDNHLVNDDRTQPVFLSNYWGPLAVDGIDSSHQKAWIEISAKSYSAISALRESLEVRKINKLLPPEEKHVLLHSFLTFSMLIKTFIVQRRLVKFYRILSGAIELPNTEGIVLAPLFRQAWFDSIVGATAIENILWSLLFQRALENISESATCIYLEENQGWETALISNWRHQTNGRIIGFPHAAVRYWDLRYFFDHRVLEGINHGSFYPDKSIANGKYAKNLFIEGGVPEYKLFEAESLRFLNLKRESSRRPKKIDVRKALLIGEVDTLLMNQIASWVSKQNFFSENKITLFVKPHPNLPLPNSVFNPIKIQITHRPLLEILADVDLVFVGAMSSAAVEVFLSGTPLVVIAPSQSLNIGPLRGYEVANCSTAEELTEKHIELAAQISRTNNDDEYYFLNKYIPRWKQLLNSEAPF